MEKRGISKNYFHWIPSRDWKIYDQRLINKYLEENKAPAESALDPNDINTKISVYEDRVKEWFLNIAERLKIDNEAGFVILQIAIGYIEGNQQYREGKSSHRKSGEFFREAMKRIFPEIKQIKNVDTILGNFYDQVRCGLFHDGMTKRGVTISGEFGTPVCIFSNDIKINPHKFLDRISEDLKKYISELKDKNNKELRRNFELRYSETG